MIDAICESRLCTGCACCSQICPMGAIEMTPNDEGFLHPHIIADLCNNCKKCVRTCPANEDVSFPKQQHNAYAGYSKDDDIRLGSSSGGVFTLLAQDILGKNGVVFAAGFDSEFNVRHMSIEDKKYLDNLRRSKYVQSDTGITFGEAKAFLKEGREVLYCGTPCQIAGLKAFLNSEYENLLTCDLACSGVPSPKVWRMYIDFMNGRYKSKAASISFRDKSNGWSRYNMKIEFENGKQYIDKARREIFFIGFGKSIFIRRSCFYCLFRLQNTKADVTLADFWGIGKLKDDNFADDKGVSLIIVNTEKGEKALSLIEDKMVLKPKPLDIALKYNPRLVSSVTEPESRKSFFDDMRAGIEFDSLRRKYMDNFSIKYRVKAALRRALTWLDIYDRFRGQASRTKSERAGM